MKKIIFLILILFIVTGCKNNDNSAEKVENNSNNNTDNSKVVESTTSINTNSKYQEEKKVEGLVFSNASLMKVGDNCLYEVTVKNQGNDTVLFDYIKIILLNDQNNPVIELSGLVTYGTIKVNEEKVMSSYYNGEIDDVYDVKYEIVR